MLHIWACGACDPTPLQLAMGMGRLKIGDIICGACNAGPEYRAWCDENNIKQEDR